MKSRILLVILLFSQYIFSQNYHDTQGRLNISNSGQATFTVPIALPPTLHDIGPKIDLVYVSGQFGGVIGQGWNISYISNISRMSTRPDVDGYLDGVDFDSNDKLAFNGQRLLLKSGNYWEDRSTYETEIQSNTKIELVGSGDNIYFIVTGPDGSRSWFGNYQGANASDLTAYYITRFEDVQGNYMTYEYYRPFNKSLCLREIKFSANSNGNGVLPVNSVIFDYKVAGRTEFNYIKGVKQEKEALLKSVEVKTGGQLFRKYEITHQSDPQLGYERVSKIQEFNGSLESANPIVFDYNMTETGSEGNETITWYDEFLQPQSAVTSGDFDGDGYVDFWNEGRIYTKMFQTGTVSSIPASMPLGFIPITTLSPENKLNQFNSFLTINPHNLYSLSFTVNQLNQAGNGIQTMYGKTIDFPNYASCWSNCEWNPCESAYTIKSSAAKRFLEGDFNGDGISELLLLSFPEQTVKQATSSGLTGRPDPLGNCNVETTIGPVPNTIRLLDLNPNSSTVLGSKGYVDLNISDISTGPLKGKYEVSDFNSDGKSDLLVLRDDKTYSIIGFKQLDAAPWVQLELIGQGTLQDYSSDKLFLLGDFNGDQRTDIMIPLAKRSSDWAIYFANPKLDFTEVFDREVHTIVEYNPDTGAPGSSGAQYQMQQYFKSYYALDTNKDGKSDLVMFNIGYTKDNWWEYRDWNTSWQLFTYANNIGNNTISGSKFTSDYASPFTHYSWSPDLPVPLVGSFRAKGSAKDFTVLRNAFDGNQGTATHIKFLKNVQEDLLLNKVTSSNGGIVDEIQYKEVLTTNNGGLGVLSEFYSSTNSAIYPNLELIRLPRTKFVENLKSTVDGVTKYQDFKYHGFVVNLNGVGTIGLNKVARSSWYQLGDTKKIWSVTESDPLLRGAVKRTYSQLVNGSFSFVNNGTNPTGIINSTLNGYDFIGNSPYTLLLEKQTTTDFLTNVKVEKETSYSGDGYFIPSLVTSKNYLNTTLQGSSSVTTEYDTIPVIGRPNKVITKVTNNVGTIVDTFQTTEKYIYTGYDLTKTEKKGNTTAEEYVIEEYEYDDLKNVKKKTLSVSASVSPYIQPRVTEQTFDPTGRFVISSKDVETQTTTYTHHPLYGTVWTTTNPFGLTTTNQYDNWGKLKKTTDYLNKSIDYAYVKEGNTYKTTITGQNGGTGYKVSDLLGRLIKEGKKLVNGTWSYTSYEYDYLGRKIKESEPYGGSNPTQWNTTLYDDYSRPKQNNHASGLIVTTTYSGLTTSVFDGVKTMTATKNANGHVVSNSDTGGIINHTYYANGNLKTSNFEGTLLEMTYDSFGRKASLNDPSAGLYTYKYNLIGELKEQTTPKGITSYEYDDLGKISQKKVVGRTAADGTDITTTYIYNSDRLLSNMNVVNPNEGNTYYTYEYYPSDKKLWKAKEDAPFAEYRKEYTYDLHGREDEIYYYAKDEVTQKSSAKRIKNGYRNGYHSQIYDAEKNIVLWNTNGVNARNQLTSGTFGNGLIQGNMYSDYGFPSIQDTYKIVTGKTAVGSEGTDISSNVTGREDLDPDPDIDLDPIPETSVSVFSLTNNFNEQRGLLNNRQSTLFNSSFETFQYDELERLKTWSSSPEITHNLTFSTVEGFSPVNGGAVALFIGKLRVSATVAASGGQKLIFSNTDPGTKINIEATINKNGTDKIRVLMVEKDPISGSTIETVLGLANEGVFRSDYTVTTYKDVYLKFDKDPNSTDVGVLKSFFVDNVIVKNLNYNQQSYDNKGRITQSQIGVYEYDNDKKYQNKSVTLSPSGETYYATRAELDISYNAFKAPIRIHEANKDKIDFAYNESGSRSTMFYGGLQDDKMLRSLRKHYSSDGTMEIKFNLNGDVEIFTYIGGDAYSAPAVLKSNGIPAQDEYLYLHRDYLGSIVAVTNQAGNIVEKRHFDAWGNATKVQDGAGNNLTGLTVLDRGYTGHEHLQTVGLIHMNGRLYDPKVHRFLQPDNFIQDPANTQNYNRYGYVLNNPLKFTDPSGEEITIGVAIVVAVAVGVSAYIVNAVAHDAPITLMGVIETTYWSVFSACLSYGVGSAVSSIGQYSFVAKAAVQAVAHGVTQGGLTAMQGGKFWSGFAAGSVSSLLSSFWSGGETPNATECTWGGVSSEIGLNNGAGMILFGTVSGGAAARLAGGNFWQGAATGFFVSAFNHFAHSMIRRKTILERFKKNSKGEYIVDPNAQAVASKEHVLKLNNAVEGLNEEYVNAGSPEIEFSSAASSHAAEYSDSNKKVYIYGKNLKSNLSLASSLFHEYRHGWQHISGFSGKIRGRYGYTWGTDKTPSVSQAYLEYDAYNFEILMGNYDGGTVGQRDFYLKWFNTHKTTP